MKQLGQSHQRLVDQVAGITGDGADDDAEGAAHDDDGQTGWNRDARAPKHAAEDVPAQFVRTHEKLLAGRL